MQSSALALHGAATPSNPALSSVHAAQAAASNEYAHAGSAHWLFNERDIKALPAGGGDPQCNRQGDVEAAPTAAGIAAAVRNPLFSALGAQPCMGVRGEVQQQQGWVRGHLLVLLEGGVSPRKASCAAGAQVGSGELPFDPPAAVRP